MRRQTFTRYEDLRFALEQRSPVDIAAITNTISRFCRGRDIGHPGLFQLMSEIIKVCTSSEKLGLAIRNLEVIAKAKIAALEHGSRQKGYRHLKVCLSVGRIEKIVQGKFAGLPLAEFVTDAEAGMRPTPAGIHAAQIELSKIRRQLLSNTGKGREARGKIIGTGFRDIGDSEFHEEITADVETLIASGLSQKDAYNIVAENSGETFGNIKKICQRINSKHVQEIEDAAKAASVWPIDINRAIKARDLTGYVEK